MKKVRKKIRTLIVDDEPPARLNIKTLLKNDADVEIIGECGSGSEALKVVREQQPDLMFLDIQMPEMSGFDLLQHLKDSYVPVIVFVTAFDDYALKAFEVHAIDYLLKPFDDDRFEKALRQAKMQVENLEISKLGHQLFALLNDREIIGQSVKAGTSTAPVSFLKRIMVRSASRIIFLNVEDIDWIGAEDYYVKLHTEKKSHLIRETMNDLEVQLDPATFIRIHRSTIVNVDRIRELQPHFNGDYMVVLKDGTELRLSRSRREQVQTILTGLVRS